jgi:hypothetical protein
MRLRRRSSGGLLSPIPDMSPISGPRDKAPQAVFHRVDLRDGAAIDEVFAKYDSEGGIWAAIHLAALKAVGESGEIPLQYYKVNVGGSISLMEVSHIRLPCRSRADEATRRQWKLMGVRTWYSRHPLPFTVHPRLSLFQRPLQYSLNPHMGGRKRWLRWSFRMRVGLE